MYRNALPATGTRIRAGEAARATVLVELHSAAVNRDSIILTASAAIAGDGSVADLVPTMWQPGNAR